MGDTLDIMVKHYIFFKNSIDAYNLSQKLNNIKKTLSPTPREANRCCGVCLIYENESDLEYIKRIAKEEGIELEGFWNNEDNIDPDRMKFC